MIKKLKQWSQKRAVKKSCISVRQSLLFFGFDVSNLTDEELIERTNTVGRAIAKAGITVEEAGNALIAMNKELI